MTFLKLRPEIKVTVTKKQYATLWDPEIYPLKKFGIPTSKNIGDMLHSIFLEMRPEAKVTVTLEKYATLHDPKMYSHTKQL